MSSSNHGNQQSQKVGSNSGLTGQAGRDLTQIQNKIYIGSSFFKDNLEEVDFWNRPCHFISVILFLLQMMLAWIFMGFQTEYKFPFKTLRGLIFATINGELVEYVSENQIKNNKKIAGIVDGIDREYISIDKSITLELETEIAIQVVGFLSSNNIDKKEEVAEFLGELKSYYDSFTTQIENQKREKYRELYEWRKTQKERASSTQTLKFINQLITLSSSKSPSDTLIYELIEVTEKYISQQKRGLPIQELSDLKQLKKFLLLISEKFVMDGEKPSDSFFSRYNTLLRDFENTNKRNQKLEKYSYDLEANFKDILKELSVEQVNNERLTNEFNRSRNHSFELRQEKQELENNINQWQKYSKKLESSKQSLDQELIELRNELKKKDWMIDKLNDPIFYLQEYFRIGCISKSDRETYHNNPNCHHWRGFVLEYIIKKSKGESTQNFIVSQEYNYRKFARQKKCDKCQ